MKNFILQKRFKLKYRFLYFTFVLILFSGCFKRAETLQDMSENTLKNAENIKKIALVINDQHGMGAVDKIMTDINNGVILATQTADEDKRIFNPETVTEGGKKVAGLFGAYFGLPPALADTVITTLLALMGIGGAKKGTGALAKRRKEKEIKLAEADPSEARKWL